ncbi:hypothetical protein JRQ81_015121 [Phrynocephalus forsythii]|uniref:DDE-1 domain-containing protein n=1 Tax=Phrynocephalus forsythii TaxID=171643 RepID=A0A9Q1B3P9_9SAUR|nr:hypothetical protein JRQ81_015121 [Phrynocephalus forsythii]
MDNTPAHPPGLEEDLLEGFTFIKVMFLPPNTTALLQPMNQQVTSSFKKLYTRELFRCCFERTDGTTLTLHEYWRDHFDIVSCVQLIKIAWDGITQHNLNTAWRNLWPDCVAPWESPAPAQDSAVLQEIVSLRRNMGLEVDKEDVSKIVEGHGHEISTHDLISLQQESLKSPVVVVVEEEETSEEESSLKELREICDCWEKIQTYFQ